jgi:hypothetical protein
MADDIVIDKQLFHERLTSFVTKWKADKRSGDQIFNGAGAIATVVGKASDPSSYTKPAAFQVSLISHYKEMARKANMTSSGCSATSFPRLCLSSRPISARL